MVYIFFIPISDSKVIYHQGKIYVPVLVHPDYVCDVCWCIDIRFDVCIKCLIRYYPCLYYFMHLFFDSDIYKAVNFLVVQFIVIHYLLGSKFDYYFVIFVLLHWIHLLEAIDIYNAVFGIWDGYDAAPMEF